LFEYFGESHTWPQVASNNYGQFDIAGFPKPHAFWYRANWLAMMNESDPGRPPMPVEAVARILSLGTRYGDTVNALVSTESAELFVDGKSLKKQTVTPGEQASWEVPSSLRSSANAPFVKNITLLAFGHGGDIVQRHSIISPSEPQGLQLSIDVPSPLTGTGDRLLLDGHDIALMRLEVVDADGRLVAFADSSKVSFEVVSGPGRLVGVSNGDPKSHYHQQGAVTETYGGLARVIVQAGVDCVTPRRELIVAIDADPAAGLATDVRTDCPTEPILVRATAAGLGSATIEIPVSGDSSFDSPEAVASRSVNLDSFKYLDEFTG
jgi:hypothetical protein